MRVYQWTALGVALAFLGWNVAAWVTQWMAEDLDGWDEPDDEDLGVESYERPS